MAKPNLALVYSDTGHVPAVPSVPAINPEPLAYTDEGEFRAQRRKWEELVRRDGEIPASERLVLLELATYASCDAFAWPAAETLAQNISVSLKTAQRAEKHGRQRGWLVQRGRRGFGGSMQHWLSADPEIAGEIERRVKGQELIRQHYRNRRRYGEE